MIKVLLADDQELIRQSLSFVMSRQEDIEMVGTAANGCEALELVEEKQPDVVLLDIRMPEMDGVECTRRIKQEFPGIKVIILTTFDDDDYVFDALRYGASGYLLKCSKTCLPLWLRATVSQLPTLKKSFLATSTSLLSMATSTRPVKIFTGKTPTRS